MKTTIRNAEQWAAVCPKAVAGASKAHIAFLIDDAKKDLAALFAEVERLQELVKSGAAQPCEHCEPDGVWATDGAGPFDCYACGKKASAAQSAPVENDAFFPGSLADLLFQLGEKGVGVSGGTHGDRWRVSLPQTVAAQSAPAWEREAFEAELGSALLAEQGKFALSRAYEEGRPYTFLATKWAFAGFQAGAAWQRTQSAGVPDGELPWTGEQLARAWYLAEYGPGHDLAPGYAVAFARELATMLAAAPAQPAVQDVVAASLSAENQRVNPAQPLLADRHPMAAAHDQGEVQRLREALEHARLFIRNGIDLGYIRMPDADTPDPAHETLPMIDAALAASTGQEVEK